MIDLTGVAHHPAVEELSEVLSNRNQNEDRKFFRAEVAYFMAKIASNMRAVVQTEDRGVIPVNVYAMLLAGSGYGKNHSIGIMEGEVIHGFRRRFLEETFPILAEQNLHKLATDKAVRSGEDEDDEYQKILGKFNNLGSFAFDFDAGTSPAIKQMRQKLVMANAGAISFQMDEIGLNLSGNMETLTVFLELFDQGLTKGKLTKETKDSTRGDDFEGKTPTNMLLFGSPSKLFDGAQSEELFNALLDTGYARRCIFSYGIMNKKLEGVTAADEYDRLANPKNTHHIRKWAVHFHSLGDPSRVNWVAVVERPVGIKLMEYKLACEAAAAKMSSSQEIEKAEISHRYMKALKLAGAYAFVDGCNILDMQNLLQAIKLVEESAESFVKIINHEPSYVKLARFVAEQNAPLNYPDLYQHLKLIIPKSASSRNDLMNMAIAWGYKNNIIIKKSLVAAGTGTMEQFLGETLEETDLNNMILSYSESLAYDYQPPTDDDGNVVPLAFEKLHLLTQAPDMQWCNHHFKNGHRSDENTLPGFNMLVIDVDGGNLNLVHKLMGEVKYMTYTTKRHTPEDNRFRIVIPINYVLRLDKEEYAQLVNDVISWLPFRASMDIDFASNQRSKTWKTCETGSYYYNLEGAVLDILPFIPKTAKNEIYHKQQKEIGSMDNLERWFASRMITDHNRNNMMIKYALALVDSGLDLANVHNQVHAFNKKLPDPMEEAEINSSIMVTVGRRLDKKGIA